MALKKVVKAGQKEVAKAPEINISEVIAEYNNLNEQIKVIDDRKKELATQIKEYAKNYGTKDDKGSYYSEQDNFVYGATAKKKISINREKAEKFFKGKKLWKKVIDTVEVINEDKVEALVTEQVISMDDLESITDVSVSYSVLVKQKETEETMPEVQVSSSGKKTSSKSPKSGSKSTSSRRKK